MTLLSKSSAPVIVFRAHASTIRLESVEQEAGGSDENQKNDINAMCGCTNDPIATLHLLQYVLRNFTTKVHCILAIHFTIV